MNPEAILALMGVLATLAGGSVWAIKALLRHLCDKDKAFTDFIANHMSDNTKVQQALVSACENLADAVRENSAAVSRCPHVKGNPDA